MRVAHFLHRVRLEDGGVVRATLDLCGALAARGHEVTLVTSDATDVPEAWKLGTPGCPKVDEIPPLAGPLKLLSRWSRRFLELKLPNLDLVHIHEFWQPAAAQVAMLAKRLGTPYIVSAHGMLDDWSMAQSSLKKQVFLRVVGNRMFRGAGVVHCTAEGEAQQAARHVPARRTGVVPLVMDLDAYRVLPDRAEARACLPGKKDVPSIAFLGRLHPKKGLDRLIEATAGLVSQGGQVEVFIGGTGEAAYEAELRSQASRLGVADSIHFLGHVSGSDKINLLRGVDVLTLPSHQENFGLVLVESLACGTPVITTKAVDIWPELQAGGGAIILEDAESVSVRSAIDTLLGNAVKRREMGQQGRRWVFEHLHPERVLDQFESLYSGLIEGADLARTAAQSAPIAMSA